MRLFFLPDKLLHILINTTPKRRYVLLGGLGAGSILLPAAVFASFSFSTSSQPVFEKQVGDSGMSVLAAETQNPNFIFNVNVPSFFSDTATFEKDATIQGGLTVQGKAVFANGVDVQGNDINLGTGKITASNILYSISAGDGLSITDSQTPTITNTGVTQLQGKTGKLSLEAGSGITIDGLKISASGNTDQDVFTTVAVSGQSDITTSSTTDTLTFVAGSGITLTTDATNKKLTITSTGGGSSGVTTLDSLSGGLTIANTTGSGSTITIDDASTSQKGIAQFNSTNFSVTSGIVNLIQSIATSASPSFVGMTLSAFTTNGGLLYTNASGVLSQLGVGTSGQVLTSSGTGSAPSWQDMTSSQWSTSGLNIYYSTGNIGVGSTTPNEKLDVNGRIYLGDTTAPGTTTNRMYATSGTLYWNGSAISGLVASQWTTSGSDIYYNSGNVAIGTTTASNKFLVNAPATADSFSTAIITATDATQKGLVLQGASGQSADLQQWQNDSGNVLAGVSNTGKLTFYDPTVIASYSNTGGTGNRTSSITATENPGKNVGNPTSNLVNGSTANDSGIGWWEYGASSAFTVANDSVKFDFATQKIISGVKIYFQGPVGYSQGTWKWQGSNDNSAWTDLGSSFTITSNGNGSTLTVTTLSSNTTGYRYYRMQGVSGCLNNCISNNGTNFLLNEFEFKIASTANAVSTNIANNYIDMGGNTLGEHALTISASKVGKALAVFNETGDQDILSASTSGTTKFRINNSGQLYLADGTAPGTTTNMLYANSGNLYWNGTQINGAGSSQWTTSSSDIYYNTGNIAIGTTSTSSRLDLKSSATNSDVQRWMAFDGSRLARLTETSGGAGWFEVDNASGVAQTLFRGDGGGSYFLTGNVGIGTSSPVGLFDLEGGVAGKALAIFNQTGDQALFTASASGVTKFIIANDGNVGIGTTNTTNPLTVYSGGIQRMAVTSLGVVSAYNFFQVGNTAYGNGVSTFSNTTLGLSSNGTGNITLSPGGTEAMRLLPSGNIGIGTTAPIGLLNLTGSPIGKALAIFNQTGDQAILTGSASGVTKFVFDNSGNIGMGITAPTYPLQVSRNSTTYDVRVELQNTYASGLSNIRLLNNNSTKSFMFEMGGTSTSGTTAGITNVSLARLQTNSNFVLGTNLSNPLVFTTTDIERMRIESGGNVGIGTTSPLGLLNVSGAPVGKALVIFNQTGDQDIFTASASGTTKFRINNSGQLYLADGTAPGTTTNMLYAVSGNLYWNGTQLGGGGSSQWTTSSSDIYYNSGNVGLGTTSPSALLELSKNETDLLKLTFANSQLENGPAILLRDQNYDLGRIQALVDNDSVKGALSFQTGPDGVLSESMRIQASGNIGIGTTVADQKLEVAGNLRLTGTGPRLEFNETDMGHVWSYTIDGDQYIVQRDGADAFVVDNGFNAIIKGNFVNNTDDASFKLGAEGLNSTLQLVASDTLGINIDTTGNVGILTQDATYPLQVGTDGTNGNGAYVSAGGDWTNGSSREFKENYTDVNKEDILTKINSLDVQQWNYKGDTNAKHIGPFAEDFYNTFNVGNDNKHISTIDPAGVAIIGIQALSKQLDDIKAQMGIASISANFAPTAQSLGIEQKDATISGTLSVLGRATLTDLGVTGKIVSGLTSIDGADGSINVVGDLKLQSNGFGKVDLFAGKVTVDNKGNIKTEGTLTAKKVNIDTTDVAGASAGIGKVTSGSQTVTIQTNAVTNQSLIQVTFNDDYAPATRYWISAKSAGNSFTVKLDQAVSSDAKFNWWIVN